jgi:putative membrane protein
MSPNSHTLTTKKRTYIFKQFNWKALLVRVLVNALTLIVTVMLTPTMGFVDPKIWTIILLAIALGLLNALIKPIIQFLTLSYIFATYGLVVVFINTIILYMLSWLLPGLFHVDNFLWAFFGAAIMGLVAGFLESLFGLTLPIVDEESVTEPMRKASEFNKRKQQAFPFGDIQEQETLAEEPIPTLPKDTTAAVEVPTPTEEELAPVPASGSQPDEEKVLEIPVEGETAEPPGPAESPEPEVEPAEVEPQSESPAEPEAPAEPEPEQETPVTHEEQEESPPVVAQPESDSVEVIEEVAAPTESKPEKPVEAEGEPAPPENDDEEETGGAA